MTVSVEREGNVARVVIDNPPVNVISASVRQGLMDALVETEADGEISAVVLHCQGRTFVAGADVTEFDKPPVEPHLPDVIAAIETARKPWVAALHGTVLGGGLELAMGCHARVALADTRLGLPEVTLGLIPGAGGTVRLPRLVPADLALTMIAGGKPIPASKALAHGLVDKIADGDLLEAALSHAASHTEWPQTLTRPLKPHDATAFASARSNLLSKARGQISIPAAVEAVERSLQHPAAEALALERQSFLDLKASDQCKALRHIFFAERKSLSHPRTKIPARPFQRIGVVGGGTMGAGIATACLTRGLHVTLIEQSADRADAARETISKNLTKSAARGLIANASELLQALDTHIDYAALGQADLVIEAVFEDMDVKKDVFRRLEASTRPDAILATNTSYLDVNDIANVLRDPSRAIGLHFFSPAHIMKLLEIVLPDAVADDVVATAAALSKRLGKIGVLSGVCDGFIGNRIMSAYRQEADYLVEDGASPQQVDAAMRDYGFAMGIFEVQDLAGLDIAWAMRKRQAATRPASERYVQIADRLCEAGRFGRKTGAGWYDYADNTQSPSDAVAKVIAEERDAKGIAPRDFNASQIMTRILDRMQAEAAKVVDEGIARNASDVDVVMVNGYGFPRWRGGPLFAAPPG